MSTRFFSLGIATCWFLLSCGSGPPPPSATQYLADARNNLSASDFNAALKNLERSVKLGGEPALVQQSAVLHTAVVIALAEGSKQMAEAYGLGRKAPAAQAQYGAFSKMRADYYSTARSRLMDAMQSVMDQRRKLGDAAIPLELSFPGFAGAEDPALAKIKDGRWVEDAERQGAELKTDRSALARTLTTLVGAGADPHKGQELFSKGQVNLDPRVYLIESSAAFLRIGVIFDRRGLDELDRLRTVNEVVRDNLDAALKLLAAKPDKDLEARAKKMRADCEKTLKALTP
ncbi:MAG: hypothetical protein LAN84_11185 [Acidobacteriia bacterium]|nr:hypothetical protein [Terriglobia bacterium]